MMYHTRMEEQYITGQLISSDPLPTYGNEYQQMTIFDYIERR